MCPLTCQGYLQHTHTAKMQPKRCAHIDEILLNLSDWTLRLDFQIVAGALYAATFAFGLISNVFVICAIIKYRPIVRTSQVFIERCYDVISERILHHLDSEISPDL